MRAPSESSGAIFLGYSVPRIVLAVLVFAPTVFFSYSALKIWKKGSRTVWIVKSLNTFVQNKSHYRFFFGLGTLFLFACWLLYFLPEKRAILWFGSVALYFSVAKPVFFYGTVLGVLALVHILVARHGLDIKALSSEKNNFHLGIYLFFCLLAIVVLISVSGIGLGFDASIWNAPGTPILISQLFIVLFLASLIWVLAFWLQSRDSPGLISSIYFDAGLAVLIWLFAAAFWLLQPAPSTYYDTSPLPPNYQSYPLSDAFNHDVIANNILIGEGFRFGGQVAIRRPVYVMFLAGLEALLGANYEAVVVGQVLVLALFPTLLYFLGTKLHSRLAGLLLAGMITFREANSIVLGDVINTSHAKLLMADLPTALMIAGLALAVFVWMRRDLLNRLTSLLVGGLLGWSILLRSQSLTLIPFVILLVCLVWGWRIAWRPILLFLFGVSLVAGPWIVRNRVLTGQWVIEDAVVSGFLANRYSFTPGTFGLPFLAGESEGDYYARHMASVRNFAFQNPGYVVSFVADNFIRNQLLNFLATPLSLQVRDLESHVRELPYWPGWQGELPSESYLPMLANLALISLGIAVAWKRFRWVGLMPVFINFGFTLNLALARVSGWRYNLPIDWTVLLYYAIGFAQIVLWIFVALRLSFAKNLITNPIASKTKHFQNAPKTIRAQAFLLAIIGLGLLGSSFLIIEQNSNPRYSRLRDEDTISLIENYESQDSKSELDRLQLLDLLEANRITVLSGRALHPRFYRAGEGEPGREFILIDPIDFKRVTFYLIGPDPASVVFRVENLDIEFPASSDVVVLRCGNTFDAAALIMADQSPPRLYISADLSQSCPVTTN